MTSVVIKLSAVFMFICFCAAYSFIPGVTEAPVPPVTEICMQCICEASSGCRQVQCSGNTCGLFHITLPYWIDAGRPILQGGRSVPSNTYHPNCESDPRCASCAIDPLCAAQTVQSYMRIFAQDCNGDGQVNCFDYMAIHMKGGYNCQGDLPAPYVNAFNQCIARFSQTTAAAKPNTQ